MAGEILGAPFDFHTGGVDLIFPHHENEIAQMRAARKCATANFWAHNEHLFVDGKKMSKSLGNFYSLEDLLEKDFSPDAIRFFFVSNHYRAKLNLNFDALRAAENSLKKLRNFARTNSVNRAVNCAVNSGENLAREKNCHSEFANCHSELDSESPANSNFKFQNEKVLEIPDRVRNDKKGVRNDKVENSTSEINFEKLQSEFLAAIRDDLNFPRATAALFEIFQNAKNFDRAEFLEFAKLAEKIYGVDFLPTKKEIPAEILKLAETREKFKSEKNWQKADEIRAEIQNRGFEIRDSKNGFKVLPR
jgi:cysteinyl-tRNA synthetase